MWRLIVFAVAIGCAAQQPAENTSGGSQGVTMGGRIINGKYWRGMTESQRYWYLFGYGELAGMICSGTKTREEQTSICGSDFRAVQLTTASEQITAFYADPANISIPVFIIVAVAVQRVSGSISDERATEWLKNLRRTVAHLSQE